MAIGPPVIDRMDDRLDAVEAALVAALPARVIKRSLLHFDDHEPGEIEQGVVMIVSAGESGYRKGPGMAGKEGTHRILLVGHLKVAENSIPQAIEAAELGLIEEIKGFVRKGASGMSLDLDRVEHSRQLEHPYGWCVAYIDAGAPRATTH